MLRYNEQTKTERKQEHKILTKLWEILLIDNNESIFDNMVRLCDGKIYIDGVVYDIIHNWVNMPTIKSQIEQVFETWAKWNGGNGFDFEYASVIVKANL